MYGRSFAYSSSFALFMSNAAGIRTPTTSAQPRPNVRTSGRKPGVLCAAVESWPGNEIVFTFAPGGGVNRNVDGSMGSKLTDVYPTESAGDVAPRGVIATRSGTRVAASTLISIEPTSVAAVRGRRKSAYVGRPATIVGCRTETCVVGRMAPRAFEASAPGVTLNGPSTPASLEGDKALQI